ncbi:MAG: putative non-heme bromoperoxidase BpoC [Chlamydiia bacterium]|nr:putative non-heme bromoperoxidase BpoC [Chlamydiia bacterium]
MPEMKVNDATFYYEIHGEGFPLVLVCGFTRDSSSWCSLKDLLSKHFKVLIFDNRGVGRTVDSADKLSVELMAKDTVDLAKALGMDKFHVLGHSMGGTIVQEIATSYPDSIEKLVISASSPKWRKAMLFGLKTSLVMVENNINIDDILNSRASWSFGESFLQDPEKMATWKKNATSNPYPQSVENQKRQFRVLETFDGRKKLSSIKAETLIFAGREDIITLLFESEFMLENIPNAELQILETGHALNVELPEVVANSMLEFLK